MIARVTRSSILLLSIVAGLVARTASADEHDHGFVTYGRGDLRGTVTTSDRVLVVGARVHVIAASGADDVLVTDARGQYRAKLIGGEYALVYVEGDARISGVASVPTGSDDVVAYWWMRDRRVRIQRLPQAAYSVPCRRNDHPLAYERDCRGPSLAKLLAAPWLVATPTR